MKTLNTSNRIFLPCLKLALLALAFAPALARSAELQASDTSPGGLFGLAASLSGGSGLVGSAGQAYVFRDLAAAAGGETEDAVLMPSDPNVTFGFRAGQSGGIGIIGTRYYTNVAYVFRNLDTVTGSTTENAQLVPSNGKEEDRFGEAVGVSGGIGLVGAPYHNVVGNSSEGAVYLFRNLNAAAGVVTENAMLVASDGRSQALFGNAICLSGRNGLIGASQAAVGSLGYVGAAYLFRNLDTAAGTVVENAKLIRAGLAVQSEAFGYAVGFSGSLGLIGNPFDYTETAAYVFRHLDTATGTVTEDATLIPSEGTDGSFGVSVSVSGSIGLVGATGIKRSQGAGYLYLHLDSITGTAVENVKVTASDAFVDDRLGASVVLEGDLFIIGADNASGTAYNSGKAYTGSVSALTTLDAGATSKIISRISFVTRDDWVIGQSTDANQVTLRTGDTAQVVAAGKGVYIGRQAGSENNALLLAGSLSANAIHIGSPDGNAGNVLRVESTAHVSTTVIRLATGNRLLIAGDAAAARAFLKLTPLQVLVRGTWTTVTLNNYQSLLRISASGGYTTIMPVAS